MSNQPASALSSPRFCNMGTFMRMPRINSAKGMDFAIAATDDRAVNAQISKDCRE